MTEVAQAPNRRRLPTKARGLFLVALSLAVVAPSLALTSLPVVGASPARAWCDGSEDGSDSPSASLGVPPSAAFPRLRDRYGVDVNTLSNNLHQIKRAAGLSGDDDVLIDPETGDVYKKNTGEHIGNVLDG